MFVVDPEMFAVTPVHSAELSLHCQVCVCLGGPPYQARVLLLTFAVSDKKAHDKKRGPRASDLGWSSRIAGRKHPAHRLLEDGVRWHRRREWPRWAEHGWSVSRSRARKTGGPTLGGFPHVRCAEPSGHPFLAGAPTVCSLGTCCTGEEHR